MGQRGPKPRPKALRLLGQPSSTSRQPATVLAADPPHMPSGLSSEEQAAWAGVCAELASVPGLLAGADRGAIELVARLEPAMRAAAVVVREKGCVLESFDKAGVLKFVQTRPEATFYLKAVATLKALYAEMGLTPSGRSRVSLTPAAPTSKLDQFLAGGTRGA